MPITYLEGSRSKVVTIKVKLGGKQTGTIKKTPRGWKYFPKGANKLGGSPFPTLAQCKESIEAI